MQYDYLIKNVSKLEEKIGNTEQRYFETIKNLSEVARDLNKFDAKVHLIGIIKPFLVEWGTMARVVNQVGLDWNGFGLAIKELEPKFAKLREKRFLEIDFNKESFSNAIINIYRELKVFPKLGGSTNISKVIHVLNPEVFIMWDSFIRETYHRRNKRINEFSEGYLEFLKEMHKGLIGAFNERRKETGKTFQEIEKEVRSRFKNKTLARILDEFNYETYTCNRKITHNF